MDQATATLAPELPTGTILVFHQDEPPAGWEVVPNTIVCRKL
jgi:hypothetical protein